MVKLLETCNGKLKGDGSIPFLPISLTLMFFFHYTLQLHGILQYFLLLRDGSHLSAEPKNSECQIFYFFDVFRRTLKIPGENPGSNISKFLLHELIILSYHSVI